MKRILIALVAVLALAFAAGAQAPKKAESKKSGSEATTQKKTTEAPAQKKAAEPATEKKGALIDINSASADELKSIPGIGDAYSAKIIQNRPYRAKNELVQKNVLPQGVYDKVKDRIVARQATAKKK